MLVKEYRIAMPLTVDEYRIGQLYMIAKHSHEQSESGEGVETVHNVPHEDALHGPGRYTEKRIHLSSRLPYFVQSIIPKVFYVTEKSWNFYPYTETEYTCSFLPRFNIFIKTRYENNNGSTENSLGLNEEELVERTVEFLDIAYDELQAKHYKEAEDPKFFKSKKTGRGPLVSGWIDTFQPIMTSYKWVSCSFEVWGLQTRVENYAQAAIREILLLGHRQAFSWIDSWFEMKEEDVREFESKMQSETNQKVAGTQGHNANEEEENEGDGEDEIDEDDDDELSSAPGASVKKSKKRNETSQSKTEPKEERVSTPTSAAPAPKSWFSWR